jgi:hypothetical protein
MVAADKYDEPNGGSAKWRASEQYLIAITSTRDRSARQFSKSLNTCRQAVSAVGRFQPSARIGIGKWQFKIPPQLHGAYEQN